MSQQIYPAVVHKTKESDFGIMFPDVPGCISAGETLEEALLSGAEALEFHFDGLLEDGDAIPAPTELNEIIAQELANGTDEAEMRGVYGIFPIFVRVPTKWVRLSVSMDESLVARIDEIAGSGGRSQFLADAAREKLAGSAAIYGLSEDAAELRMTRGVELKKGMDLKFVGHPTKGNIKNLWSARNGNLAASYAASGKARSSMTGSSKKQTRKTSLQTKRKS